MEEYSRVIGFSLIDIKSVYKPEEKTYDSILRNNFLMGLWKDTAFREKNGNSIEEYLEEHELWWSINQKYYFYVIIFLESIVKVWI